MMKWESYTDFVYCKLIQHVAQDLSLNKWPAFRELTMYMLTVDSMANSEVSYSFKTCFDHVQHQIQIFTDIKNNS